MADLRVPKFSRREKFVTEILDEHPLLATAMVNRIWAIMMSPRNRFIPMMKIDSMHRPSHPELLEWLAEDFPRKWTQHSAIGGRHRQHSSLSIGLGQTEWRRRSCDVRLVFGTSRLQRSNTPRSIQQVARGKFEKQSCNRGELA